MAITRTSRLHVRFGEVFPRGLYMFADQGVEPARDFDKSTRDRFAQAMENDVPVWTVDVLDPDDQAQGRQKAITVRIVAPSCPTLPETTVGPVRPVELEGLSIAAYVEQPANGRPRVGWSYRATGIRAPSVGGPPDGQVGGKVSEAPTSGNGSGTSSASAGGSGSGSRKAAA